MSLGPSARRWLRDIGLAAAVILVAIVVRRLPSWTVRLLGSVAMMTAIAAIYLRTRGGSQPSTLVLRVLIIYTPLMTVATLAPEGSRPARELVAAMAIALIIVLNFSWFRRLRPPRRRGEDA